MSPFILFRLGDKAFVTNATVQAMKKETAGLTPQELHDRKEFNDLASHVRVSIEWLFGLVGMQNTLLKRTHTLKLDQMPLRHLFMCGFVFTQTRTTFRGNIASEYFRLKPPTFREWVEGARNAAAAAAAV